MTLRDYQLDGITDCSKRFAMGHTKIIYQLPTGAGKTVIFTEITHRYIQKNSGRVLIVVHREELLRQTCSKLFLEYNIVACEIKAGMKTIPDCAVYVCMVESLSRRLSKLDNIGLLILDECHIAVHNKIIDNIDAKLTIGCTATPIATNKKEPLKKRYDSIVMGPQIPELIKNKYLAQNITYAPREAVDRNSLVMKGGDFDEQEMGKEFSKPKFVINTVQAYNRWGIDRKTVIFNVNIEHSKNVYDEFTRQGIVVKHLDSNCTMEYRKDVLNWFKVTPNAVLCNVGILTTGFDEPTIETVIINRATSSVALWLQMTGRGSRIVENEKYIFTIVDMGGNALDHGDWSDVRDWKDLFLNPPKKSKNGVAPCKNCPICEAIVNSSQSECNFCNFVFPKRIPGAEELLESYVMITKNINVEKLISDYNDKKQYFVFFRIINSHVKAFQQSKVAITPEIFDFVLKVCFSDCKEWCHLHKKKFNKFHQTVCLNKLKEDLNYVDAN